MRESTIDIETAARAALDAYKARRFSGRRMPSRTCLEAAGVELDVVRCFMMGLTISETLKAVKIERGVSVSRNAVGRLYRDLFLNKVYPIKRLALD